MTEIDNPSLIEHLTKIKDPRIDRTKEHLLTDILTIAVCATICGADGWTEMQEFGEAKEEWFGIFLELPNGIPSHDTFRRVFMLLRPNEFQQVFLDWVKTIAKQIEAELVSIDGKHLRGSRTGAERKDGKEGLRLVSAWASENGLILGPVKTREKSNEITAIPELLRVLELKGCIVTIDAMGCQTETAAQIIAQKADYVLSLKGNQGTLHKDIEDYFYWAEKHGFKEIEYDRAKTLEKGHGRIEERCCWVTEDVDWLLQKQKWVGLKSIVMVESRREISGKEASIERRYFISSLAANAKEILRAVRGHWGIENSLHWVLDVAFREDHCQIKDATAAENMAILRHFVLNLLKQ